MTTPTRAKGTTTRVAPRASLNVPLHLPVLVGVSAVLYSGGLAAVSAQQAAHEAAKVAAREPSAEELAAIAETNDLLESTLALLDDRLGPLSDAAAAADARARDLAEQRIALEQEVTKLTGEQAATVRRVVNTVVPRRTASSSTTTAPSTVATTGASGAP